MKVSDTDQMIVETLERVGIQFIAVYRFGSQAEGQAQPDRDVDIAVLSPGRIDPLFRFDVEQELALILHADVDLVDLVSVSVVLQMQVIAHGRCVASHDETARQAFETYVYSAYARLNEERRAILDDIQARGSVYG